MVMCTAFGKRRAGRGTGFVPDFVGVDVYLRRPTILDVYPRLFWYDLHPLVKRKDCLGWANVVTV